MRTALRKQAQTADVLAHAFENARVQDVAGQVHLRNFPLDLGQVFAGVVDAGVALGFEERLLFGAALRALGDDVGRGAAFRRQRHVRAGVRGDAQELGFEFLHELLGRGERGRNEYG